MSKRQYLYICSNPSMPGLLKIGKTTRDPHERSQALYSTGVPTPFFVEYSWEVTDCSACERLAHQALDSYRVTKKREFFRIPLKTAHRKILTIIGAYQKTESRGKGERRESTERRRASIDSAPASPKGKPRTPRIVVAPAAWPFPTSSRP
jgi:hypothetical protein